MKVFIEQQKDLKPQFLMYAKHLQKREGLKEKTSTFFAKQLQDFTQSGMTPKDYFKEIREKDNRAAETFLLNFKQYSEFVTNQYFEDFHQLRWELGRKHKKGDF